MEEEYKVELALYIIQLKIVKLLNSNNQENFEKFKSELEELKIERDKVYQLDTETINKIYEEYKNKK